MIRINAYHSPRCFGYSGASAGAAICKIIRDEGPISRAELGRRTGLSKSTISLHVERLLNLGLVAEETVPSGKRTRLVFNSEAGYVVAIDLGVTSVDIALCDLGGTIIHHEERSILVSEGPEKVLAEITSVIDAILWSMKSRLIGSTGSEWASPHRLSSVRAIPSIPDHARLA